MIAVDTNILLRLLIQDDPQQSSAASALLEEARSNGEVCYVADVVLCEMAWVLASSYGANRVEIGAAVSQIAADPSYLLEDAEGVAEALADFREGKAELSDYLIATRARRKGARTTFTFDRKLKKSAGCTLLR